MRLFRSFAIILSYSAVFPARAENTAPFPNFPDPTTLCGSGATKGYCVKINQDGYNIARELWPVLSEYTVNICIPYATKVPPEFSYKALGDCVQQLYSQHDKPLEKTAPFQKW
jgi:hypothetical protein